MAGTRRGQKPWPSSPGLRGPHLGHPPLALAVPALGRGGSCIPLPLAWSPTTALPPPPGPTEASPGGVRAERAAVWVGVSSPGEFPKPPHLPTRHPECGAGPLKQIRAGFWGETSQISAICLQAWAREGGHRSPHRGIGRAGGASGIDCSNPIPRGRWQRHGGFSATATAGLGGKRPAAEGWAGKCWGWGPGHGRSGPASPPGPSIFNELPGLLQRAGRGKAGPGGGGPRPQPCPEPWPPNPSGHERVALGPCSPPAGQGSP